jgi:hypothetical protein
MLWVPPPSLRCCPGWAWGLTRSAWMACSACRPIPPLTNPYPSPACPHACRLLLAINSAGPPPFCNMHAWVCPLPRSQAGEDSAFRPAAAWALPLARAGCFFRRRFCPAARPGRFGQAPRLGMRGSVHVFPSFVYPFLCLHCLPSLVTPPTTIVPVACQTCLRASRAQWERKLLGIQPRRHRYRTALGPLL